MKENYKKLGLPAKRIFLMGLAGLKHKTVRLIISVILAVAAFSFVGFSLTVTTADTATAELKKCYADGISTVVLKTDSQEYDSYKREYTECNSFTDLQISTYEQKTGKSVIRVKLINESVYNPDPYVNCFDGYSVSEQLTDEASAYDYLLCRRFDGVAEIHSDTTESDLALTPDSRLSAATTCRLPANTYEIAITDLKADFYINYGYLTDEGETINVDKPDDLIGKTLDGYTIVGIYSTSEKIEDLKQISKETYGGRKYSYYINGTHIANFAFVYEGYISNSTIYSNSVATGIYYKLSGSISNDKALISNMTYSESDENANKTNTYSVRMRSIYYGFTDAAQDYLADEVITVAYVAAGIFTFISILLTANFLITSNEERKREFGILRALGAKTVDVVKICLSEGLIIAFIEFVLSLIAVGITSAVLNVYFFIPVFFMGFIPILSVFLLSFCVTALGVIFPAVKLSRQKPVDVINDK